MPSKEPKFKVIMGDGEVIARGIAAYWARELVDTQHISVTRRAELAIRQYFHKGMVDELKRVNAPRFG